MTPANELKPSILNPEGPFVLMTFEGDDKVYQLDRINLTAETVEMCLQGLADAGFVERSIDGSVSQRGKVLNAPDYEFRAAEQPGPIASTFSWGEY